MSEVSSDFFILSEILKNRPDFFIQKFNVRNFLKLMYNYLTSILDTGPIRVNSTKEEN